MRRWPPWIAGAFAVAVAVGVLGVWSGRQGPGRGPLGPPSDEPIVGVGMPVDVGQRVSVGILSIRNYGDHSLTIRRVELLHRDRHVRLVGALAVPNERSQVGSAYGFPVPQPAWLMMKNPRRARGATIAPGVDRTAIVLGLAVSARGTHSFRGVEIDYESGGRSYRAVYPVSAELCAPRRLFSRGCDEAVASATA